MKAELCVDTLDMAELVGISEVLAVPGEKEIAFMERSERKVKRVADRVLRHYVLSKIDVEAGD